MSKEGEKKEVAFGLVFFIFAIGIFVGALFFIIMNEEFQIITYGNPREQISFPRDSVYDAVQERAYFEKRSAFTTISK